MDRPPRVKEHVLQITVDRGWDALPDPQAGARARAKIKSESTPPLDAPPKTFVKPVLTESSAPAPASRTTSVEVPGVSPEQSSTASMPSRPKTTPTRLAKNETTPPRRTPALTPRPSPSEQSSPLATAAPATPPPATATPVPVTEPGQPTGITPQKKERKREREEQSALKTPPQQL